MATTTTTLTTTLPPRPPRPVRSLLWRELTAYFTNPTAYIFITLFVLLSGIAAFWVRLFFLRNMANLDQLNGWFPVLLLFLVPAITMAAWAEERKQGTEELLLTLPASEWRVALGKYLGCLSVYAVCLLFSASHILVLAYLGRPDIGLLVSTYVGYLLAGAGLIGLGLFASSISASATIAYIAGACVCALLVGLYRVQAVLPGEAGTLLRSLSLPARMESFSRGVIDVADVAYFVGLAALGVFLTAGVLRRRRDVGRAAGGAALHGVVRFVSVVIVGVCVVMLLDRAAAGRIDATAERLWTLSPETRRIVRDLPAGKLVTITAYVSPSVPPPLVQQRATLDGVMRELEATSGGRVRARTVNVEPNTEGARDVERAYAVTPRSLPSGDGTMTGTVSTYFAVTVESSGGESAVIPFLAPGLPVEYELARAMRSVASPARKTVGVLETGAGLFGSFDFQTMSPRPDWPIIAELRKQYAVERVSPGAEVPSGIDVLLVAQPSTLNDEQLKRVIDWVGAGKPTIIIEDPLPLVNPAIATSEPKQQRSQFEAPDQSPKANLQPLWDLIGARVSGDAVVWDSFNPRPALKGVPNEYIWATVRKDIGFDPFSQESAVTSGLQEVVVLFGGRVERLEAPAASAALNPATPAPAAPPPPARTEFRSLIRSGPTSGVVPYSTLLKRSFFGGPQLNPERRPTRVGASQTLAAELTGGDRKVRVVLLADLDMIGDAFFALRENGGNGEMDFDNVPLILNAVDSLADDNALVELRKKRRVYRTLERIDERRQQEFEEQQKAEETARSEAQARLSEAQARLDKRVQEVRDRTDLDEQSKEIMAASVQNAEQSRLAAQTVEIEQARNRAVVDAQLIGNRNIQKIETSVRIAAVTLPPVPALLTGLFVLVRRRRASMTPRID